MKIIIEVSSSLEDAIKPSDIVIVTTQSKTPIITSNMLHPGLHINAFGADQPGKVELDQNVVNQSLFIVDDKELVFTDGSLNVAYKNKQISSNQIYL